MSKFFGAKLPFFYGWVILGVCFLATFVSGPGQTYSASIFIEQIIQDFGWSRTLVAGLYTAGSLTAGVTMIFAGRLLDKLGPRLMMTAVGILFGFAGIWMSRIQVPFELFIGFALIRILGQSSLILISNTLIALWFVRHRGKATAAVSLGGALSGAAFPMLIHLLISNTDWRNTWLILSYIIWGTILIPALLLVRKSPESVGMTPDGEAHRTDLSQIIEKHPSPYEPNITLKEALRTKTFWLLIFAGSSQPLIGTALTFHQVSLFVSKGLTAGMAASVFGIMAPMQILGSFLAGFLSDKYPNRYLLAAGQALLLIGMFLTFTINSVWQAILYGAVTGLGAGFVMVILSVIWPNYYGRKHIGSIRGASMAAMVSFAALGPLPFGWIYDITGSYSLAILIFASLPVSCAVAAFLAKPPQRTLPAASLTKA